MGIRVIKIEVPEWPSEEDIIELNKVVKEKLIQLYLFKRVQELIDKLNFSEKELEEFEKTREEVWKEKEYRRKGLIK